MAGRAAIGILADLLRVWRLSRAERRIERTCAALVRARADLRRAQDRYGALLREESGAPGRDESTAHPRALSNAYETRDRDGRRAGVEG
ncbi:hypothetical protein [Amaricoccus solimangrovi]|uniref:Uncharacterized protein n=1 Tax=Amaricoccus solimangrovi TaxID=2589815 RepID=A0A501WTF8_9RHOB|nr:hypothetical protein [Amaricoccus solimangrovi]TPE50241.1 hypothetical protein FJM51_12720 [Amaricoccus solimangrovi]